MVYHNGGCRSLGTGPQRQQIRVSHVDQQHWVGEQRHLLYHRLGQSTLLTWRSGWHLGMSCACHMGNPSTMLTNLQHITEEMPNVSPRTNAGSFPFCH